MIEEYFGDGSVSVKAYVCILNSVNPTLQDQIPLNIITTNKDKALEFRKKYGYEVYSTILLKEVGDN